MQLMLSRQWKLQSEIVKKDVLRLEGKDRVEYIRVMYVALIQELCEALNEMSWKPWTRGEFFNREAYLKELIDVFHFWMNLVLAAGAPGVYGTTHDLVDEITLMYFQKADVNSRRAENGYDGVSSKCICGRDIEDGTPSERHPIINGTLVRMFACPCGRYNGLGVLASG